MWLFNFDRVIWNVNGNLEGRIWIKFGIQEGTGGCKGPGGKLEGDFSVMCFTFHPMIHTTSCASSKVLSL